LAALVQHERVRAAPFGRFGNSARTGAIRLPGVENVDFSVGRAGRLLDKGVLDFRAEFFNLFNHFYPDPRSVDLDMRSSTFGSVGGGVQGITTRVIQLGAQIRF
jgi:hypothetical protein